MKKKKIKRDQYLINYILECVKRKKINMHFSHVGTSKSSLKLKFF